MTECIKLSVRLTAKQLDEVEYYADQLGCSKGTLIREACQQFCPQVGRIKLIRRILDNSKIGDTSLLIFPGDTNKESKSRIKTYVHEVAFSEMKNLGKKTENEIMEFICSSIADSSILYRGQITTMDDGENFICFRVNLVKVYCHFAPMQITILSVIS